MHFASPAWWSIGLPKVVLVLKAPKEEGSGILQWSQWGPCNLYKTLTLLPSFPQRKKPADTRWRMKPWLWASSTCRQRVDWSAAVVPQARGHTTRVNLTLQQNLVLGLAATILWAIQNFLWTMTYCCSILRPVVQRLKPNHCAICTTGIQTVFSEQGTSNKIEIGVVTFQTLL